METISMKTIVLLLFFAALVLFSVINWNSFMAPTNLWLLVSSINAPLGLILLGFIAVISLLFLVYILYIQASHLVEKKRLAREMKSLRDIAEQAESSRMKGLDELFRMEFSRMEGRLNDSHVSLQKRMDEIEQDLRALIEQTGNSLSASIGELEDRLTDK
jgi:biopolymer transport protein ExbB/TolQ